MLLENRTGLPLVLAAPADPRYRHKGSSHKNGQHLIIFNTSTTPRPARPVRLTCLLVVSLSVVPSIASHHHQDKDFLNSRADQLIGSRSREDAQMRTRVYLRSRARTHTLGSRARVVVSPRPCECVCESGGAPASPCACARERPPVLAGTRPEARRRLHTRTHTQWGARTRTVENAAAAAPGPFQRLAFISSRPARPARSPLWPHPLHWTGRAPWLAAAPLLPARNGPQPPAPSLQQPQASAGAWRRCCSGSVLARARAHENIDNVAAREQGQSLGFVPVSLSRSPISVRTTTTTISPILRENPSGETCYWAGPIRLMRAACTQRRPNGSRWPACSQGALAAARQLRPAGPV